MKLTFMHSTFLDSVKDPSKIPPPSTPLEIALVGRSNVGKSSLINFLLQRKKLAKVSSTPGKTRALNFFSLDKHGTLIDLPGYGFANTSKQEQHSWKKLVQTFLARKGHVNLILHLLDIRHPPSEEDLIFFKWALSYQKQIMTVFTKSDKLSKNACNQACESRLSILNEVALSFGQVRPPFVVVSIKNPDSRRWLIKAINGEIDEKARTGRVHLLGL